MTKAVALLLVLAFVAAAAAGAVHTAAAERRHSTTLQAKFDAEAQGHAQAKAGIVKPLSACTMHGRHFLLPAAKKAAAARCDVCVAALAKHVAAAVHRKTAVVPGCPALLAGKTGAVPAQCQAVTYELARRAVELVALTHAERGGHHQTDDQVGAAYATFLCGSRVLGCCTTQPPKPKTVIGKGELRTPKYFYKPYRAIRATTPGFTLGTPSMKPFKLAPTSVLTPAAQQRAAAIIQAFNAVPGRHTFALAHGQSVGGDTMVQHILPFPVTIAHPGARALKFAAPATRITVDEPCEPKDLYGFGFEYWERIVYRWDFYVKKPADDQARAAAKAGIVQRIAAGEGGFDEPWKDRFFFAAGYADGSGCSRSGTEKVWAAIATAAQNGDLDLAGTADYRFAATTPTSFTVEQVDRPGITAQGNDKEFRYFRRDLFFGWTLRKPDGTKLEKAGIQSLELEEGMPTKIRFVTADAPNRPADLDVASDLPGRDTAATVVAADQDVAAFIGHIAQADVLKTAYAARLPTGAAAALAKWFPAVRAGKEVGTAFTDRERDHLDTQIGDANCRTSIAKSFRGTPGKAYANYVVLPPPYWAGQRWVQKSCGQACLMAALVRPEGADGSKWAIDRAYVTDDVMHVYGPNVHGAHGCNVDFKGRLWHEIPYDAY